VLQSWCINNNAEYCGVPVGTIKLHATGKGNAGKDLMIAAAEKIIKQAAQDDNHADAVCLANYVIKELIK
jgi:Holliday junction resolvasome RuvABC endonuclease subunit